MDSLSELVQSHAVRSPDSRALMFLEAGERVGTDINYKDLDAAARVVSAELIAATAVGDRVLLVHQPGVRFIIDFLGCLYAGVVPVPVYPPIGHREINTATLVAALTEPVVLLTDLGQLVAEIAPDAGRLEVVDTAAPSGEAYRPVGADDLALIQFTSGSTGRPRGVMISHRNMMANQVHIDSTFRQNCGSVVVSWLPLYHDMGLLGSAVHALYLGAQCIFMSPLSFLQRPMRWLSAISKYGGTVSAAPNFAFDLCCRRSSEEEIRKLDLSRWEVAVCGGEPVRAATIDNFSRRFQPVGFRRSVFSPSYGLAEATLLVSGVPRGEPPTVRASTDPEASANPVVSCGPTANSVLIVGPDGTVVGAGSSGEIWVHHESVASGYWRDPEATRQTFDARLKGETTTYLRTGDLGFLQDNELFVTGRLNDLLVIRGRNYYPSDLEDTIEHACSSVRTGCVAVVQVDDDIVVVAEQRASTSVTGARGIIAGSLARQHGVRMADLLLLQPGTIPKTSSGKLRRNACRELYSASRSMAAVDHRTGLEGENSI